MGIDEDSRGAEMYLSLSRLVGEIPRQRIMVARKEEEESKDPIVRRPSILHATGTRGDFAKRDDGNLPFSFLFLRWARKFVPRCIVRAPRSSFSWLQNRGIRKRHIKNGGPPPWRQGGSGDIGVRRVYIARNVGSPPYMETELTTT